MSFLSFIKKLNPFKRAESAAPKTGFAAFIERQRTPLEQVAPPPPEAPTWDAERLHQLAMQHQTIEIPRDDIDGFLHFGEWLPVQSSNVSQIHYDGEASQLQVEYSNGNIYQYEDVSIREAEAFARAVSKGKWVWDRLRRRKTVFGWQKPYSLLSGVSAGRMPQWMRKAETRAEHGTIMQEGERNTAQLVRLMPRGWHRAAAKFRQHGGQ